MIINSRVQDLDFVKKEIRLLEDKEAALNQQLDDLTKKNI